MNRYRIKEKKMLDGSSRYIPQKRKRFGWVDIGELIPYGRGMDVYYKTNFRTMEEAIDAANTDASKHVLGVKYHYLFHCNENND